MALTLICAAIVVWILYTSVKFYRGTSWDEPAESSPDFAEMRKKEAQLLNVQDVLQEACDLGKLSKTALEEYRRYAESELAEIRKTLSSPRRKPGPSS